MSFLASRVKVPILAVALVLVGGALLGALPAASTPSSPLAPAGPASHGATPLGVPSALPGASLSSEPSALSHGSLLSAVDLPLSTLHVVGTVPAASVPAGGATVQSYSQAASTILTAAAGFGGDSWSIELGIGIALPSSETLSTTTLGGAPLGCTISWIGSQPSTLTFPATPSSSSTGTAATYEFVLTSPTASFDVVSDVVSGTANLLYKETSSCESEGQNPNAPTPPTGAPIDSPAAVALANRVGGTAFLQAHPTAVQEWVLEHGSYALSGQSIVITNPPYWIVEDVGSCGSFLAEIDGLTGAVLENETTGCTPSYSVNFQESGLPSDTAWSVELGGDTNTSTSGTVGFSDDNGSYGFDVGDVAGYAPSPATGTVDVSGAEANVTITFAPASTYAVTFQETGLPTGTYWAVELGNLTLSSNTSNLPFYEPNGTHRYTVTEFSGWTPVPAAGKAKVVGAALNVPITFSGGTPYLLQVNETGLPTGTVWGAFEEGSGGFLENFSSSASLGFLVPNGTYFLEAGSVSPYYNTSTFAEAVVAGGVSYVTFAFTGREAFALTFNASGLPANIAWEVTLDSSVYEINSTTTSSIGFVLPNGTYEFEAGGAAGYNATPLNGSVVVDGAPASMTINFTGPSVVVETFAVTFTESGLPTGTQWSVTLSDVANSSTTGSIGFSEPNGSDSYTVGSVAGYQADPASGSVLVDGGPVEQAIVFTPLSTTETYTVTFTETGLTSGTSWSVTFAGTTTPSTTTTDVFTAANGSFPFTVAAVTGYTVSPSSGSVDVQGGPAGQAILFTPVSTPPPAKYSVTFTESGLASGTSWSVTLAGSTLTSTTATIVFSEPNGTYTFTVGTVTGYTASPASGSVPVSGASASQAVAFTASQGSSPPPSTSTPSTFLGLPGDEGYGVVVVLVLIVLVVVGLVAWRMRKGSGGASAPPASPPTPPAAPPSSP